MNPLHNITTEEGQRSFVDAVPHHTALGLRYVESGIGRLVFDLPWQAQLVGDPDTGVIHGGALTATFDACCGGAVMTKLDRPCRIVTLDLRIDYLRPAKKGQTIRCEAECKRLTKQIAFARAIAHDGDPDDLIATATGTFMLIDPEQDGAAASGIMAEASRARGAS